MNDTNKLFEEVYENRIYPDKEVKQNKVLLSYQGSELFALETMSCLTGAAKSKKTFLLSLLLEQTMKPSHPGFRSAFSHEILYFDTEMSESNIQQVSKRFSNPEVITFLSIRQYSILDRYKIIEEAIKRLKPSIVVIDGIKELVGDINDGTYATKLTNKLLQWTTIFSCHIVTVLHTNPGSDKPRGALGTEMINKCSTVLNVQTRGLTARVNPQFTRDKSFEPFFFKVNADSKPVILENYVPEE